MTVGELQDKLKGFDPKLVVQCEGCQMCVHNIEDVELMQLENFDRKTLQFTQTTEVWIRIEE